MRPRNRWIRGKEARGRLIVDKKDCVNFLISKRSPVEDGPGADGEDEKFKREGDEKAVALNLTTMHFVSKANVLVYLSQREPN